MLGIPNILGYPYPMIFKTEPVGVGYQKCRDCCYIRQMNPPLAARCHPTLDASSKCIEAGVGWGGPFALSISNPMSGSGQVLDTRWALTITHRTPLPHIKYLNKLFNNSISLINPIHWIVSKVSLSYCRKGGPYSGQVINT